MKINALRIERASEGSVLHLVRRPKGQAQATIYTQSIPADKPFSSSVLNPVDELMIPSVKEFLLAVESHK